MNRHLEKARAWYAGLKERERRMALVGAVALAALLLIGGVLLPLESAVSSAEKRADERRDDLAWMHANAAEIASAGPMLLQNTGEAPVVIVDRVGREAGLGPALKGSQPSGTGVRVQLEAAPFDTLVTWISTLDQRYGLSIESITVDRGDRPGVVNANITFAATRR
jgi:general secretion pathway protein M